MSATTLATVPANPSSSSISRHPLKLCCFQQELLPVAAEQDRCHTPVTYYHEYEAKFRLSRPDPEHLLIGGAYLSSS